jgi:RNase H-like domain found in reverse transcriptase/Reverse transcriptase (RNA-dependent DNA polymerase)
MMGNACPREVYLEGLMFPELHPSMRITKPVRCLVVDTISNYDVIVGRDIMSAVGIDILGSTNEIRWRDYSIPFRAKDRLSDTYNLCVHTMNAYLQDDIVPKSIESAQYQAHDTDKIAAQQLHLTPTQRAELAALLRKFPTLFDGKLRCYPSHKIHLHLIPGSTPKHLPAYPVPTSNLHAFKEELRRMVKIGVLEPCGLSEWASPTFIIPKKDGTVRWISDFRELNKCIMRRVYPLPNIQAILKKRKGYKFFTKLDLSMAYYTYELDEASKDLCVIITPFGKFRYNRLPMGVKQSPDVAQELLESLLRDIEECDVYIDDIGCFDDSWEAHLVTLERVLSKLRDKNFAINPRKVEWARQETDWLGYWLTPIGLKPWKKKVDAILLQERPQTLKQLRSFIGAVTYYRDMFRGRSHILSPLTELTKSPNKIIEWGPAQDKAFREMKAVMARDVLLRYPDHNLPFHVYSDASDYQLGAIIVQNGMPVAFYSRKLNAAQRNYTTMEKELLSIVETLREYRTMLYGCKELHVYTDHRNLTFHNLNSQRVIRWRLFLEEFNPTFHYIKGELNSIADSLSRLPRRDERSDGALQHATPSTQYDIWPEPSAQDVKKDAKRSNGKRCRSSSSQDRKSPNKKTRLSISQAKPSTEKEQHTFSMLVDDQDMVDCFVHIPMNFPTLEADTPFPLDFKFLNSSRTRRCKTC